LPTDLMRLEFLDVGGNQLTSLTLPTGLTNLTGLFLVANQLTTLTLPPDMTQLTELSFLANPLTSLVLSEALAASTNLSVNFTTVSELPTQNVSVFTYPLTIQLISLRQTAGGAFQFAVSGPPGVYAVFGSVDLGVWSELAVITNTLGFGRFTDEASPLSPHKFYRARRSEAGSVGL
jgi:hypothetical protein